MLDRPLFPDLIVINVPVLGASQTKVSCSEKTKAAAVLVTGNNQSKRTHCFSNRHGRNPRREAEFKPVPDRLQATGITEPWFSKRACPFHFR